LTDSKLLFLARPRKSNQKEGRPKTRCDFQSQFPHIKRKIGAAQLAQILRILMRSNSARYDPIFILMLGFVSREWGGSMF